MYFRVNGELSNSVNLFHTYKYHYSDIYSGAIQTPPRIFEVLRIV
jgi:hypothetical protein